MCFFKIYLTICLSFLNGSHFRIASQLINHSVDLQISTVFVLVFFLIVVLRPCS